MTVLSVVFGMAATIIPKVYTYYISTALFAIFGLKMIYEGYFMKDSDAQEEMEEVQSTLRKREDELMRSKRGKYDDADAKRKNSNSDKDDEDLERGAGAITNGTNGNNITSNTSSITTVVTHNKNPEMSHRQRKHNNNNNHNKNTNKNSCDVVSNKDAADSDNSSCHENDVFLNGVMNGGGSVIGVGVDIIENKNLNTYHSSPALSASTNNDSGDDEGICEDNSTVDSNGLAGTPLHDTRHGGKLTKTGKNNSVTSLNSLSLNSNGGVVTVVGGGVIVGGQPNGELKQLGGSKKRLERSASLVQDAESGVVRKIPKKSAAHVSMRILMQAFTMTFLAEWGDRSQLTTIILAASKNVYGVITGGIIGHSICTGLAVIGGRMVAAKISVRTVTIIGGIVFVGFAVYALIVKPDDI
ncbi:unnamed protein product [Ceratitis capitata]|uniref:(Mediterranean fruit fly) hypothetical protein n=1 Tax=Ceratitis capitata TaxID=7213 RepID=A0A811TZ96_CERCA|nr:unnamed protein product [Ceratitis capitata]